MSSTVTIEYAGKTSIGRRAQNEDSYAIDPRRGLMVVADGLGGHRAGEVASQMAVEALLRMVRQVPPAAKDAACRKHRLSKSFTSINSIVYKMSRREPEYRGMGTTLVAAWAEARSLTVAHVGDSRAYLCREKTLRRLTEDHCLVAEYVARGLLPPEAAEGSPLANILSRAVGTEERVEADVCEHDLRPGDLILLASDGLTRAVDDQELGLLLSSGASVQDLADDLIRAALDSGGEDNVTVVLARVTA